MPASAHDDEPAPVESVTFASLGVPAPVVGSLADTGITRPFPVQVATLPDALAGRDVLGRAQTGSGKTLGFSIPLVARLSGGQTAPGRPRGLVLVPTRELAAQVVDVLMPLARAMGLRVATIYGGVSYRPQIVALERATDIFVACPGRLEDLIKQGHCGLSDVKVTVIDEADQMADLGFLPVVRRLLQATPADGQRLLFSATLDNAIDVLIDRFLSDPAQHSVDQHASPAEIEHHVITISHQQRLGVLAALAGGDKRSLVFTRTKHGAQRLARQLTDAGIPAAELHGNLRQGARAKNLAAFASGIAQVMVATDIAARGIHVDGVDLVIHADPPAEHKAYVHRSGRTARGGAEGVVVTLQTAAQSREVRRLMREAGVTAQQAEAAPDSEVLREIGGPPAPRVRLTKPVTDMVKLPKRHPASGADDPGSRDGRSGGRRRGDRQRGDRPDSDSRRPGKARRRTERFAERRGPVRAERGEAGLTPADAPRDRVRPDRADRRERPGHQERPGRSGGQERAGQERPGRSGGQERAGQERASRSGRQGRPVRPGEQDRPDRRNRSDRGYGDRGYEDRGHDDRHAGNGRSWPGNERSWERNGRPARPGGTGRHQAGDDRRPAGAGGRTGRPEFPGRPGAARKRRSTGQGRHF